MIRHRELSIITLTSKSAVFWVSHNFKGNIHGHKPSTPFL